MLVIVGKTTSGKDTVVKELIKKGYTVITSYTTRPMRDGEDPSAYHFISKNEFEKKINKGFFAEWTSFNITNGVWLYGTAKKDYVKASDKMVVCLNPQRYRRLCENPDINIKSVYLYANNSTIKERLRARGASKTEIMRRIFLDDRDFIGIERDVDKIVYNNSGTKIKDVIKKITDFAEAVLR